MFNERIVENINEIDKIESIGDPVGDYNLQNKVEATIKNNKNIDIEKYKRNFLTNSSCGVCGKTSLDTIELINNKKMDTSFPIISENIILKSPELLINEQSEFSKTGGIHASALINDEEKLLQLKKMLEDITL